MIGYKNQYTSSYPSSNWRDLAPRKSPSTTINYSRDPALKSMRSRDDEVSTLQSSTEPKTDRNKSSSSSNPHKSLGPGRVDSDLPAAIVPTGWSIPTGDYQSAQLGTDITTEAVQRQNYIDPSSIEPTFTGVQGVESISFDENSQNYGPGEKRKHRCSFDNCQKKYTRKAEKDRHEKEHNGEKLNCGCCRNHDKTFQHTRKDKVVDHMRNTHGASSAYTAITCQHTQECGALLFPSEICHQLHLFKCHPSDSSSQELFRTSLDSQCPGSSCNCFHTATAWISGTEKADVPPLTLEDQYSSATDFVTPINQGQLGCNLLTDYIAPWNNTFRDAYWQYTDFIYPGSQDPVFINLPQNSASSLGVNFTWLQNLDPLPPSEQYCETLQYEDRSLSEVHPADFMALQQTGVLLELERLLLKALPERTPHSRFITYNVWSRSLKLRGLGSKIDFVLEEIKGRLSNANSNKIIKQLGNRKQRKPRSTHSTSHASRKADHTDGGLKIFPLSKRGNNALFETWMNVLLPNLPRILRDRISPCFSASLILLGLTFGTADPTLLIESADGYDPNTYELIQREISELCVGKEHSAPKLKLEQGELALLALLPEQGSGFEASVAHAPSRADEHRQTRFSFIRPSQRPGPGASVGLPCTDNVSGTLGGYLMIDEDYYLLTSAHFVDASRNADHVKKDASYTDQDEIESPSQRDLDEMIGCLRQCLRQLRNSLENLAQRQFPKSDIDHKEYDGKYAENLEAINYHTSLVQSWDSPVYPKRLGRLIGFGKGPRSSPRSSQVYGTEQEMHVMMDWAAFKITGERGENSHRFRSNKDAKADFQFPLPAERFPQGKLCTSTCDMEPGAPVHYVGEQSAKRHGEVMEAPVLIGHEEGLTTWESVMLPTMDVGSDTEVEGDSGAWLFRDLDNKVMGQIVGRNRAGILFTPIMDIIDDVKKKFRTDKVMLPHRSGTPENPVVVGEGSFTPLANKQKKPVPKPLECLMPRWVIESDKSLPLAGTSLFQSGIAIPSSRSPEATLTTPPPSLPGSPACPNHGLAVSTSTDNGEESLSPTSSQLLLMRGSALTADLNQFRRAFFGTNRSFDASRGSQRLSNALRPYDRPISTEVKATDLIPLKRKGSFTATGSPQKRPARRELDLVLRDLRQRNVEKMAIYLRTTEKALKLRRGGMRESGLSRVSVTW